MRSICCSVSAVYTFTSVIKRRLIIVLLFSLLSPMLLFSSFADASGMTLEKELRTGLEKSRAIIERIEGKLPAGSRITDDIDDLKTLSEDIRITHMLLQERFGIRTGSLKTLGKAKAIAIERHRVMEEGYRKALNEYLSLIDSIPPDGTVSQTTLDILQTLLKTILHKKKRPILGSLPYKHPDYPAKQPDTTLSIKPAYKGGDQTTGPEDTAGTPLAPINNEIAVLAQTLNWNPVSIYEWVKNNIETEWYRGCMKGAAETLHQKSGNDCDQAALLVALLRASGFPSRYVRGTIEFFAGRDAPIEKIKNLTGIEDPMKIAEFFQKAGIPYTPVIQGGKIANFRIEHIWVESYIPYANYRGAIIDEHGKTWLGLDTSIKVTGYEYNSPMDIFSHPELVSGTLANIRDKYLSAVQTETPLEYLRSHINTELETGNPPLLYNDFLKTRTLLPEVMNILPNSMQFDQKRITHEYTEIPAELIHKVRFTARDSNNTELLNIELNTFELSNKQVVITYEPETVEDQNIINSYRGLDNTPAYLVRLRPVLKVNGERTAVGKDGPADGRRL